MKEIYRVCALTRKSYLKKDLIRIYRTSAGEIGLDINQNKGGRGLYLSKNKEVFAKVRKIHFLEKQLKVNDASKIYDELDALL